MYHLLLILQSLVVQKVTSLPKEDLKTMKVLNTLMETLLKLEAFFVYSCYKWYTITALGRIMNGSKPLKEDKSSIPKVAPSVVESSEKSKVNDLTPLGLLKQKRLAESAKAEKLIYKPEHLLKF